VLVGDGVSVNVGEGVRVCVGVLVGKGVGEGLVVEVVVGEDAISDGGTG
jgi:hypothetical protein